MLPARKLKPGATMPEDHRSLNKCRNLLLLNRSWLKVGQFVGNPNRANNQAEYKGASAGCKVWFY